MEQKKKGWEEGGPEVSDKCMSYATIIVSFIMVEMSMFNYINLTILTWTFLPGRNVYFLNFKLDVSTW